MIRRFGLSLALATVLAAPAFAQPPAPPVAVPPRPSVIQFDPAQSADQQGGQRGFRQRNRGDGQGFGGQGGGGRGFNRLGGGPANLQAPQAVAPAPPSPALAAQGRGPAAAPALPADVQTMRALQGSISAVFDPGAKTARIKLIETDDHGVEGVRTLKPGDVYRDGWRLSAVTATEATLRKGKSLLHVNFSRGWPAPIQPAVLVQPIAPQAPANGLNRGRPGLPGQAVGRGPTPTSASAAGLGLSNARVGGSPPAPLAVAPARPGTINIRNNPDGSRTMTSVVNGQTMVISLPAGR